MTDQNNNKDSSDNSSSTMGSIPWINVKDAQPAAGEIVWMLTTLDGRSSIYKYEWRPNSGVVFARGTAYWCALEAINMPADWNPKPGALYAEPRRQASNIIGPDDNSEPESFTD